jgi:hypothetical protein
MTDHEQLHRWNGELLHENSSLRHAVSQLEQTLVQVQIERDVTVELLGAAMDAALKTKRL